MNNSRRTAPSTLKSTGFTLIANVTNPARDLKPSVHGYEAVSWHKLAAPGHGNIFYQNGTGPEKYRWYSSIITDLGVNPAGLSFGDPSTEAKGKHDVNINFGSGEMGIILSEGDDLVTVRPFETSSAPATFAVRNETIEFLSRNETEKSLTID